MRKVMQMSVVSVSAVLLSVAVSQAVVIFDGLYHNNTNLDAQIEAVPYMAGPGVTNTFLEIDYANTNVNVHILTRSPLGTGSASTKTRFFSNTEDFNDGVFVANVILDSATNQFHDTPVSGSTTLDLWRVSWRPPNGFTGTVFYAPQVLTTGPDDQRYLVSTIGDNTNNLNWSTNNFFWVTNAQAIGDSPFNVDYSFEWTNAIPYDFDDIYFNGGTNAPGDELVPGLGVPFLQYSYDPDTPSYVHLLAPSFTIDSMNLRLFFQNGGGEVTTAGSFLTNVVVDATNSFHGLPAAGSVTLDVWRAEFNAPNGWTTNSDSIFYAMQITTPNNPDLWLAENLNGQTNGVAVTNNWTTDPQLFTELFPGNDRDWSFSPTGAMVRVDSLKKTYLYHNNTNLNPQLELVPDMGVTPFLDVDYGETSTTFYVMTDSPMNAVPGENVSLEIRVWNSFTATESWLTLSFEQNVQLSMTDMFHGQPTNGMKQVDIWSADWPHPTTSGVPVTAPFDVYYAPLLKTTFGANNFQTDYTYLIGRAEAAANGADWGTNNFLSNPQYYGADYTGNDYYYRHSWRPEGDTDSDGIPDWWELENYGGITNADPAADSDSDSASALEEYIANTQPTNGASVFVDTITNAMDSVSGITLYSGVPSSTLRLYDVFWTTNLKTAAWTAMGLDEPGNLDSSAVELDLTPVGDNVYFRTGVKLP